MLIDHLTVVHKSKKIKQSDLNLNKKNMLGTTDHECH